MSTTAIGAGWAHGGLPPWMEQHPGFDEAAAADLAAKQLAADLMAERFGAPADLAAEQDRLPRPRELAELVTATRGLGPSWWQLVLDRRAVLDDALRTAATHHPAVARDSDRLAA